MLVLLHSSKDLSIASEEKAVQYANMAGNMYTCRELLLEHVYFTEESQEKNQAVKHRNILTYMDLLTRNIYYGKYETEDERIRACKVALVLWKTLIYDGNYLFFHCRIQSIYSNLARSYAKLQNREKTIEALKMAIYHARCFDEISSGVHNYTSEFVNSASFDTATFSKNYTSTDQEAVLRFMENKWFDFIRDDPAFVELVDNCK